ncbi:MAG: C1 family peptidase [Schleiferiaceae bacterium]|nr:C1 family peptidase [Schleiferiaceae bacterium]
MNKLLSLGMFVGLSISSLAQVNLINKVSGNGANDDGSFEFKTLIDLEATPVKNQGQTGTCWSYSTTGFIESELIRMGKPAMDLAEMYTVRKVYQDKANRYVRLHGYLNFAQGGAMPDMLYVIKNHGAVPQDAYPGLNYGKDYNDHDELEAALKGIVDAVVNKNSGTVTPVWKEGFTGFLDAYLGPEPSLFKYEGKSYTPRTFADNVLGIKPDDYIQLTSYSHQPFQSWFAIEVPDNWTWGLSYNVPLDDMMATIDHALENGFTIAWATDVSEKGFSLKNGVAVLPSKPWNKMSDEERSSVYTGPHEEMVVTQELRQLAYDNYESTDDHGMQIVGKVADQTGAIYYIVKNSWGERENAYRSGYIYASEAFVRYKTLSILLHKGGVPKRIAKGM